MVIFNVLKSKWGLETADQTLQETTPKYLIIFSNMEITVVNGRWQGKLEIYSSFFS